MKKFKVTCYSKDKEIEVWMFNAKTPKGVEKLNKSIFKEYRRLGYEWKIEEV